MKQILLWDPRLPDAAPRRLTVDDRIASAAVRAGVAAPVDQRDFAELSAGGPLAAGDPVEVTLQVGVVPRMVRVMLPSAVAAIAEQFALAASVRRPIGGGTPTPTPTPTPSQPVAVPSGFFATPPFTISRAGSGSASTFTTDYDAAAKRPATATTIYVSPTGTANGAGTQSDPVPSINMAIAIGNATGQPFAIEVAAGTYAATQTFSRTAAPAATYVAAWYNLAPTQDCAVYCPSGVAISTLQMQAVTWNATADPNIWRATPANNASRWVVDLTKLDDTGVPQGLDQVRAVADATNPIAEINAVWTSERGASYYRSATRDMWVRMPDNRQPTSADTAMGRDFSAPGGGLPAAPAAPRRVWLDNMQFRFGRTPFLVTASAANRVDVYDRNCAFLYSGAPTAGDEGPGSFAFVGGPGEVIHDRSIASYSDLDGFNYHGLSGATLRSHCPSVYEINCKTRSNGWNSGLANNGTTLHEFCTGVRINGSHLRAADRTIHDINRSQSWNLGCTVSTRRGQDGSEQSSPFTAGLSSDGLRTDMWLDACRVEGTPQHRTSVYAGSFLNYANLDFVPTTGAGTGTVATYTA